MGGRLRAVAGATLAVIGLGGCAHSLVSDGQLHEEAFERLSSRAEEVAGTPRPADLRALPVERAQVKAIMQRVIEGQWGEDELFAFRESLVTLGLWPPDRDLVEASLAVFEEEVVGFYVPSDRTLYVVADSRVPMGLAIFSALLGRDLYREAVLAHELVHAHQHASHPMLVATSVDAPDQSDAASAASAALEGDAMRAGFELSLRGAALPDPEWVARAFEAEAQQRRQGPLSDAPALIRLTYAFPYAWGYRLAYAEGNSLLDAPPASTEQLLHPERRHADFLAVDLTPLVVELPAECTPLFQDTMGELNLSVLFRDLSQAPAAQSWEGWDGDRYLVAHCRGGREFLWLTYWDSAEDAEDFEIAYLGIAGSVAERADLHALPRTSRDGRRVVVYTGGLAPLLPELTTFSRRARVATLEGLRAHFAASE